MKANVIKKWLVYGHQGRKAGYRCIIQCLQCDKKKELEYSRVLNGAGKHCSKECSDKSKKSSYKMQGHPNWKGGKVIINGYYHIKQEDGKYIREQILLMEEKIDRKLFRDECVHHINSDRKDNRLENLQLMKKSDHNRLHGLANVHNLCWKNGRFISPNSN